MTKTNSYLKSYDKENPGSNPTTAAVLFLSEQRLLRNLREKGNVLRFLEETAKIFVSMIEATDISYLQKFANDVKNAKGSFAKELEKELDKYVSVGFVDIKSRVTDITTIMSTKIKNRRSYDDELKILAEILVSIAKALGQEQYFKGTVAHEAS